MPVALAVLYMDLARVAVEPATQDRLYEYARASKNDDILLALLDNPALDVAVDMRIGTRTVTRVTAAWLTRPDRSAAAVLGVLDRARTPTVRAAIAGLPGLPDVAYDTLAATGEVRVAVALLRNPDAPRTAVLAAAATYAEAGTTRAGSSPPVADVLGGHPWLADIVGAQSSRVDVCTWAVSTATLREDVLVHIVADVLLPRLGDTPAHDGWLTGWPAESLFRAAVLQPDLPPEWRQRVFHAARATFTHPHSAGDLQALLVASPVLLPSYGHPEVPRIAAAASPAEMQAALVLVLTTGNDELAAELLRNPHLHADDARSVVALLAHGQALVDCAHACVANTGVAAVVLARVLSGRYGYMVEAVLTAAPDPAALLDATAAEIVHDPDPKPDSLRTFARSRHLTPAVAARLPWAELLAGRAGRRTGEIAGTLIAAGLHSPAQWAAFEQLAPQFTGSLGDLLAAARMIAEPAR